ncbi:MAG TPA: PAS domain S-box protein [Candidatus Polarisedimenticolaceae bacterium]|nr:PAS domain S-box protein [Candidatus Polarisedimenticolaceae bacterium]
MQALLAAIVDSSDDAIVSKSLEGIILSWNAGAQRIFGYTAAEAVGKSINLIIPPERRDEEREILRRLRNGERIDHLETIRLAKDGRRLDISLTVSPVRDASGRIVGASKVARDITERKRAAGILQVITDATPALISYVDAGLRYQFINLQYEAWFGHARGEILGHSMEEVLGPVAMGVLRPHIEAALRGETVHFETLSPYRDGGSRWIDAQYVPHRDGDGPVLGFFVLVLDITERKRAEEALRESEQALRDADRRKDEFLATLAHELRNPLAPLRNGVQIMRMAAGDPAAAEQCLAMMDRQLTQMARLVDDLMDMSRITSGKVALRMERVDLGRVVLQAVETSRPMIESRDHELTLDLTSKPVFVQADVVRLAQVISNLLNNAAKYTEPGGRITLLTRAEDGEAVVRVQDNGVGIPADMLGRVFDMFTQVDRALGRVQEGLGIGLTLVRRLVELHGGSVVARSAGPGQGSEFEIRMPASPRARAAREAADEGGRPDPRRILVVDDNRDAATSLAMMLEMTGSETRTAWDGMEALEAAAAFRPDVIFLDLGMPRLDGYEAARRIRQQAWGRDVVLIALSGWGQEEDRRRSLESGFDAHLVKPVDLTELRRLLAGLRPPEPRTHPLTPGSSGP